MEVCHVTYLLQYCGSNHRLLFYKVVFFADKRTFWIGFTTGIITAVLAWVLKYIIFYYTSGLYVFHIINNTLPSLAYCLGIGGMGNIVRQYIDQFHFLTMDGGTGPGSAGPASGPGNAGTWHGPGGAVGSGSGHRRIGPLMANGEFYTKPVLFGPMDAPIGWSPPKFAPPVGTIFTTLHG